MREEQWDAVWHGVVNGLIGYATIALSIGLIDVLQGQSFFHTVALLGQSMFYGLKDPAQLVIWPGAVFAYNGLHLVTFLAFGLFASWLAVHSERGPLFWYAGLVLYLFVFVHLLASVLLMTEPMRSAIPLWEILVPSLLAVILMSWHMLALHPRLRHDMDEWVDADDVPSRPPTLA